MPGPIPKPNHRHRNKPTLPTDNLDDNGYSGPVPDPVNPLDVDERKLYDWAWTTPAACGWHWSDAEIVADWARLKALAARYARGEIMKWTTGEPTPVELPSALLTQIMNREDRLYLSPLARKKARTRIESDAGSSVKQSASSGNVVTPGRWQSESA